MEFLCNHGITIANNLSYQCFIYCIMVYEWNFSGILEASILFIDGIEHDGKCFCFLLMYGILMGFIWYVTTMDRLDLIFWMCLKTCSTPPKAPKGPFE